jgi:glyoxylase-like metal-dependent hydrolase (beta-lactamase superfamily II)
MDQETIETDSFCLQVIYTPGHSPDHICLFESDRGWLFTGDLFVGGKDRALRAGYEIWEIIASLKLVAKLPVRMMFPGSARVRENPKTALNRKISYLEDLGERVLALHQQGWDERAITNKLLGKPMQVEIITLGHFSRRNLVRSFLRRERG